MTHRIQGNTGFLTSPSPPVGEGREEGVSLLNNAKRLRPNMTEVEQKLWYQLRAKRFAGHKFRRQVPLQRYIADFACFKPKVIVELDGGQHSDQEDYDRERDAFFARQGFQVLRFWNNEIIENMDGVLQVISSVLKDSPLPYPSPTRGEGNYQDSLPQGERGLIDSL